MYKSNPLLTLHEALSAALLRDLEAIGYKQIDHKAVADLNLTPQEKAERRSAGTLPTVTKFRRPTAEEADVVLFPQTWGSTALGYGGLGGSAMTTAYTVIVMTLTEACIYFGGQHLAYRVVFQDMTEAQRYAWDEALASRNMLSRQSATTQFGAIVDSN